MAQRGTNSIARAFPKPGHLVGTYRPTIRTRLGALNSFLGPPSDRRSFFRAGQASVIGNRLGAGPHLKLLVHAPDISVDGGHADVQPLGDFLVDDSRGPATPAPPVRAGDGTPGRWASPPA